MSHSMPIFYNEQAVQQEVEERINKLRAAYADNPLVKRIDYRLGHDWTDDPCVYIKVILPGGAVPMPDVLRLAEEIRADRRRLVHTWDIGLYPYLEVAT